VSQQLVKILSLEQAFVAPEATLYVKVIFLCGQRPHNIAITICCDQRPQLYEISEMVIITSINAVMGCMHAYNYFLTI